MAGPPRRLLAPRPPDDCRLEKLPSRPQACSLAPCCTCTPRPVAAAQQHANRAAPLPGFKLAVSPLAAAVQGAQRLFPSKRAAAEQCRGCPCTCRCFSRPFSHPYRCLPNVSSISRPFSLSMPLFAQCPQSMHEHMHLPFPALIDAAQHHAACQPPRLFGLSTHTQHTKPAPVLAVRACPAALPTLPFSASFFLLFPRQPIELLRLLLVSALTPELSAANGFVYICPHCNTTDVNKRCLQRGRGCTTGANLACSSISWPLSAAAWGSSCQLRVRVWWSAPFNLVQPAS